MNPRRWFRVGACTCAASAVCCFSPLLVIALSSVGLSALVSYLDRVLWPLMLVSALVMALAWLRMRRQARQPASLPLGESK